MCERFALLALKADKMFRISARLVLLSARCRLRLSVAVTKRCHREHSLTFRAHCLIHRVLLRESGCEVKDGWCDRGVRLEPGRQCRRSQRSALTHGASPPSLDRSFFVETTVLLTSEQCCASQEMQSWRVHVASFDK